MKKNCLLCFALLLTCFLLNSQNNLTMTDAILKGRTVLAPANLKQVQWIPGTNQFTHAVNGRFVRVNAANLSADTLDILSGINTNLEKQGSKPLEAPPAFTWIDDKNLWFKTDKDIYTYNLDGDLSRKNGIPAGAENTDIHEKTYKLAYTRDKGLWINIGG